MFETRSQLFKDKKTLKNLMILFNEISKMQGDNKMSCI